MDPENISPHQPNDQPESPNLIGSPESGELSEPSFVGNPFTLDIEGLPYENPRTLLTKSLGIEIKQQPSLFQGHSHQPAISQSILSQIQLEDASNSPNITEQEQIRSEVKAESVIPPLLESVDSVFGRRIDQNETESFLGAGQQPENDFSSLLKFQSERGPKEEPMGVEQSREVSRIAKEQQLLSESEVSKSVSVEECPFKNVDFQKQSLEQIPNSSQKVKIEQPQSILEQLSRNQEMSESNKNNLVLVNNQKPIDKAMPEIQAEHEEEDTPVFGPHLTQIIVPEIPDNPSVNQQNQITVLPINQGEAPVQTNFQQTISEKRQILGSPSQQKKEILIESEEQIQVPQKVPEPVCEPQPPQQLKETEQSDHGGHPDGGNQMSMEALRSLFLATIEADPSFALMANHLSENDILELLKEYTNKAEEGEKQKFLGNTQIVSEEPIQSPANPQTEMNNQAQAGSKVQAQQEPERIAEERLNQEHMVAQAIIEEPKAGEPEFITFQAQNQEGTSLNVEISQQQKQPQELEIIIQLLSQDASMEHELRRMSHSQLRELYQQMIEENKKNQEKNKNKKKKSVQPIIDLEDQPQKNPAQPIPLSAKPSNPKKPIHSAEIPKPSAFSYLAHFQKRKSQAKKKSAPNHPNRIFVNKTLIYALIQSRDFQHKLSSVLIPKESIKYQEKTEKEIALLYLNHLRKNKISKGSFEASNIKKADLTVLCKKKGQVKADFKKHVKEGLFVRINTNISEEKKAKIQELRQKRIQQAFQSSSKEASYGVPSINTLPSRIPVLTSHSAAHEASMLPPMTEIKKPRPVRRYFLIAEEEVPVEESGVLGVRQEEEIGLQGRLKRVKKSNTSPQEEKELLEMLRKMIENERK